MFETSSWFVIKVCHIILYVTYFYYSCHCVDPHISMSNYKFADFFLLFPSLCAFNSLKNKKNITHPQKVNINVTLTIEYYFFSLIVYELRNLHF